MSFPRKRESRLSYLGIPDQVEDDKKNMKIIKNFTHFYQKQDGILFWSTTLSIFFALFSISLWAFYYPFLPPEIPLFYSLPWGESQLTNLLQYLLLPGIILLIVLINLLLTWHLHTSQLFIKRMIALATVFISFLITLTGIKIILIFV